MDEIWKSLPGYEGLYEISNKGRVKSLGRETIHGKGNSRRVIAEKILKPSMNKGYEVVYLCRPGKRQRHDKLYIEVALEKNFGITPQGDTIENLPEEEWKPIAGYEGLYEISNIGRVKSVGFYVNGAIKPRYTRARLRVNGSSTNSYPKVELCNGSGGIKTMLVHRLVAEAFVPNPLGLDVVHHLDEDKTNPRFDNLEWTTRGGNVQDWFKRRTIAVGLDTIEAIIEAHKLGKTTAEILAALPVKGRRSK